MSTAAEVVPSATPQPIQVTATASQQAAPSAVGNSAAEITGAPSDWTANLNENLKGWVQNKGWKDPGSALESHYNLEKLMGAPRERLLKVPENSDDAAAMNEIYSKLGKPARAEDYQLEIPKEVGSPEFAKWAAGTFHELGLSTKQGRALAAKWSEFVTNGVKAEGDARIQEGQRETEGLKKKWGLAFDQNIKVAKAAQREFGLTSDILDKLERSMGLSPLMELLHNIGSKLGEPSFHTGESAGGALTPDMAKNKIKTLQSDRDFVKRYVEGDLSAKTEMTKLHRMAYPEDAS